MINIITLLLDITLNFAYIRRLVVYLRGVNLNLSTVTEDYINIGLVF